MKIKKGFSLADILITISVVAIIASVSLSFFKQSEPDKRIYDSTVRQLSRVIAAVNYKACSDDLICWGGNANNVADSFLAPPICPQYGADIVHFINNQCTHPQNAGTCNDTSGNATAYAVSNGQCVASPICTTGELKKYHDIFCQDEISHLDNIVKLNNNNVTFFCFQTFDLLQNMNAGTKQTICTSSDPITLPNRARLFGLGSAGTGMIPQLPANSNNHPAILLIKYDSSDNPLYGNNEQASMSDSTTGYVVVYPNGTMTSRENIKAANGNALPNLLTIDTLKCLSFNNNQCENDLNTVIVGNQQTVQKGINTICGEDGVNCNTAATNSVFKEFDDDEKGENMGSEPQ